MKAIFYLGVRSPSLKSKDTQCLASYLGDAGIFSLFFPVNFKASKDKNLREKKHGKIHGTKKSDATPFAITVLQQVSYGYEN